MPNEKFTPGPWQVVAHELKMKAGENVISVPEYNIKTTWIHGQLKIEATILGIGLHTNEDGKTDKSIWLSKENAALIAAAPEMYAAIKSFCTDFENDYVMLDGRIVSNPATILVVNYNVFKSILAKASGKRAEILANMMAEDEKDGLYDQQTEPQ
mgnify:FL=1